MRKVVTLIFVAITCALANPTWAVAASQAAPERVVHPSVVYPTGVYPADVANVQNAIDAGGTVLLKSTNSSGQPKAFNFGPPVRGSGFVLLTTDVALLGETSEGAMTTITGGSTPLRGALPVHSVIQGIHFEGPRLQAIFLFGSAGALVSANRITDVVGASVGPFTLAFGIRAETVNVSGPLVIAGNTVNGVHGQISYGIEVSGNDAEARIVGNSVSDVSLNGILVGENSKDATIVGNVVVPGPPQDPDFSAGNGILFGHTRGGTAYIADNTIVCDNPVADGILLVGRGQRPNAPENNAVIERNDITMHGSFFGGISLYDQASNNTVRANKISGFGAVAYQVANFAPPYIADSNAFRGNNISHFTSSFADVFLDTNSRNTIVSGHVGSLIDLGVGNSVSGFSRGGPVRDLGPSRLSNGLNVRQMALDAGGAVDFDVPAS